MGKEGLDRLGLKNNSSGFVRTNGSHPGYGTRKKAEKHDEYVEILVDDGEQSDLVACAAHGSWIEYRTDDQAAHVADALGVTEWSCMGYNNGGGAYDRWHITSTDIDRRSFPKFRDDESTPLAILSIRPEMAATNNHFCALNGYLAGLRLNGLLLSGRSI